MTGTASRPRVTGARERSILLATLELLAETGYDRLTLDGVAARVQASKATLYPRWVSKGALVTEAVALLTPSALTLPDTGSLRGDLLALADTRGFFDAAGARLACGLATALYREPELHETVRRKLVEVGTAHLRDLLERAAARGRLRPDVDIELVCAVVPARALFRLVLDNPDHPDDLGTDHLRAVLERIVLPAVEPPLARP